MTKWKRNILFMNSMKYKRNQIKLYKFPFEECCG
jgi:hypothetical protein